MRQLLDNQLLCFSKHYKESNIVTTNKAPKFSICLSQTAKVFTKQTVILNAYIFLKVYLTLSNLISHNY